MRIKCILAWLSAAALSACAGMTSDISLSKPIKMKLTDIEARESEGKLRKFPRDVEEREFIGGVIVCGRLEDQPTLMDGEIIYKFKVMNYLYNGLQNSESLDRNLLLVSPTIDNGGASLKTGIQYRIYAPMFPDKRLAVWSGLAVEAGDGCASEQKGSE